MRDVNQVVRFSRFGGPEVLDVLEEPLTEPGPGEVRIALRAAGLNPADYKRRRGAPQYAVALPTGIGRELAGVVEAVGAEAVGSGAQLAVGDEVFGTVPDGAFQTHLVADASSFARKPAGLPWTVAGALALVGQTAWDALASQPLTGGDHSSGSTILVSAAAGGVGGVLSQLAVLRGIRVIGSASAGNHAWLRSRGIEPVEYGSGLVDAVRSLAPDGITAAFDLQGSSTVRQFLELGIPPHRVNTNAMDPTEFGIRRVGRGPTSIPTLDALAALVVSGDVELPIAATFAFDDVADAFRRLETGHLRGKVAIVSDAPATPEP